MDAKNERKNSSNEQGIFLVEALFS